MLDGGARRKTAMVKDRVVIVELDNCLRHVATGNDP
jgi:hypothetical protein